MGLCLSANCAAEVPVFMLSGRILDRLGVERSLHLAMACYVLRLCCYLVRCRGGRAGGQGHGWHGMCRCWGWRRCRFMEVAGTSWKPDSPAGAVHSLAHLHPLRRCR